MSEWNTNPIFSWGIVFRTRQFLESTWPSVYRGLSEIMRDTSARPDFVLADYLVDAVRDMNVEFDVPIAMHWPQMPTAMIPAPYIPGAAGLQIDILTSEYASIWQRLLNHFAIYTALFHYTRYRRWVKQMRKFLGVPHMLPTLRKPDYLCLVNSFFGLEAAKDLPPNVSAIGPVLSDEVSPMDKLYATFLASHKKVLYIAFGTHVLFKADILHTVLTGVADALAANAVDGVIWAIRDMARKQFDITANTPLIDKNTDNISDVLSVSGLLDNKHPHVLFVDYAPQRALLSHPHVRVFLTHAGSASTNEAVFAGIPTVTLAAYFDQLQNAMRLRDAGCSIALKKEKLTRTEVADAIRHATEDLGILVNVERLQSIAKIAARRKYLAADLIEETLADHEGRRREQEIGKRARGMHLQTADGRMPWWKAKNWDLYTMIAVSVGLVHAVTAVLMLSLVKRLWAEETKIMG